MGKRRNTAKTGDKALYSSRNDEDAGPKKDDADPMYDEIDQFHKDKDADYLKLETAGEPSDSEDDDGMTHQHNIMDLGAGGDDDDSASSSSDDDDEGRVGQAAHHDDDASDSEEASMASSSDDDEDGPADPRQWGRKKSTYYHGDTADLELGQDQEDAFLEEEAAKEVQKARLADMTEDDFVLSDNEDPQEETDTKATKEKLVVEQDLAKTRDLSKFTKKDKRRLLQKQHSELLPIVSYFSDIVKDLKTKTSVAQQALFAEEGTAEAVGATAAGQEYLLTKTLLQSSMALNVAMYLLLKSDEQQQSSSPSDMDFMGPETTSAIPSHPVMARLEQWNSISLTLEDGVENKVASLKEQMENLVKAAALMQSEEGDEASEDDQADEDESVDQEEPHVTDEIKVLATPITPAESSEDEGDEEQQEIDRNVLNEAKFGLRAKEVASSKNQKRTRRKVVFDDDFVGDGNDDEGETGKSSFASTLNAIEQRSSTSSKKKQRADVEQLDHEHEDDAELRQGLKMMEEEMGKLDDDDDQGPMDMDDPDGGGEIDDELEDGDDFYSKVAKKSKENKAFKKSLYQVAPKYPRIDMEVEGERAISQTILKNRGLVPHKAKINRNPRVKKREQYRKAKIRRKGAVREVRTDEGHKYAGEQTGVKTGLSRSRKLIS